MGKVAMEALARERLEASAGGRGRRGGGKYNTRGNQEARADSALEQLLWAEEVCKALNSFNMALPFGTI
jgi:hypothetical protein